MKPRYLLSLFDHPSTPFLVPTKVVTAVARRRGQGRLEGRRAVRASLDGGEHGRTLQDQGTSSRQQPKAVFLAAILRLGISFGAATATPVHSEERAHERVAIARIVDEAAARFGLPASWIQAVIAAESGGKSGAISPKGAMGLMQLMPQTWRVLRAQHGLGPDPFDRRDNVWAGAAYLRQLYDQFGREGFLAAYNAGPRRYGDALAGRRLLPAETIVYVARVERKIAHGWTDAVKAPTPAILDWREAVLFPERADQDGPSASNRMFVEAGKRATP